MSLLFPFGVGRRKCSYHTFLSLLLLFLLFGVEVVDGVDDEAEEVEEGVDADAEAARVRATELAPADETKKLRNSVWC